MPTRQPECAPFEYAILVRQEQADNFDLNLFYTINEANKSVLGFKKSNIFFKENMWYVNEAKNTTSNKIEFDRQFKDITIKGLKMSHEQEEINL